MNKLILRISGGVIAVNALFGLIYVLTVATHGISDQDASMLVYMIIHFMNLPAVLLLASAGISLESVGGAIVLLIAGIIQWTLVAATFVAIVAAVTNSSKQTTTS